MTSINFSSKGISYLNHSIFIDEITEVIKSTEGFVSLDLSENYLDDDCVRNLMKKLSSENLLSKLQSINFMRNRITKNGILDLLEIFFLDNIKEIDLRINYTTKYEFLECLVDYIALRFATFRVGTQEFIFLRDKIFQKYIS